MPEFSPQMAAMIGLGVGIDYALFIVTRYREDFHNGMEPEDAVVARGRLVAGGPSCSPGITVMISLLGLFIIGLAFVRGLAVAGAVGVLVMMSRRSRCCPRCSASPANASTRPREPRPSPSACLRAAGDGRRVHRTRPRHRSAQRRAPRGRRDGGQLPAVRPGRCASTMPHRAVKPREQQFWYRWSRVIQRRPWPPLLIGVGILVAAGRCRCSRSDSASATPATCKEDQTARKAYDLMAEGFGAGSSGPLFLASTDPAITPDNGQAGRRGAGSRHGHRVRHARRRGRSDGHVVLAGRTRVSSPQDQATTDLVTRLRDDRAPGDRGRREGRRQFTAASIDFADYLAGRLPLLIGAVLILSFLLLMVVFRSLLVPLKAVVMNLLSIGAAYGVIVAIFQWGWAKSLFGVGKAGPIEAWVPMMLFAIVFGLSMDYEVFLLSRMKEEYDRTGDNATAVADGLAVTARVITAAALIMVCVFSAFVLGDDRSLKLFGLGLAVGGARRRHDRAHGAGAGDDGAARRPQLVAAEVARPGPAHASTSRAIHEPDPNEEREPELV